MLHPDSFLDLHEDKHQDRLREAETWRLAKAARQQRARYLDQLLRRLVVAAKQWVKAQMRHPKPVQPDLADLPK
jgi:hypothetical protein